MIVLNILGYFGRNKQNSYAAYAIFTSQVTFNLCRYQMCQWKTVNNQFDYTLITYLVITPPPPIFAKSPNMPKNATVFLQILDPFLSYVYPVQLFFWVHFLT